MRYSKIVASLILLIFISSILFSQDTTLQVNPKNVLRYQKIGKRYEGFHVAKVGSSFRLTSFTQGQFYFEPNSSEIITLAPPANVKEGIHTRAVGVPNNLFYQMDVFIPQNGSIKWPVKDILLRNEKTKYHGNIGVYGTQGEGLNKAFLPITYQTTSHQPKGNALFVEFVATTGLIDIQWKLSPEMDDFSTLRDGKYYYPGKAITIKLPDNLAPGDYTLLIKGRKKSDGSIQPTERFNLKI